MENTGYKFATKIVLTVTTDGRSVDHVYPIGKYVDGAFIALGVDEIAVLSDTEYTECLSATYRHIIQREDIKYLDYLTDIMTNKAVVQDHFACPLPRIANKISAVAAKIGNSDVSITYTADYQAESDVAIVLSYQGDSFATVLKKGSSTVSAIVPKKFWGVEALLHLYVGAEGILSDSVYSYSVQNSILLPNVGGMVDNTPTIIFTTDAYNRPVMRFVFPYLLEENIKIRIRYLNYVSLPVFYAGTTGRDYQTAQAIGSSDFVIVQMIMVGGNLVHGDLEGGNTTVVDGYMYGANQKYRYDIYQQNTTSN